MFALKEKDAWSLRQDKDNRLKKNPLTQTVGSDHSAVTDNPSRSMSHCLETH